MKDSVLVVWIVGDVIKDLLVLGMTTYLVFWQGHSGWWYLLALLLMSSTTLYKVLRKRYGIEE